MAIGDASAKNSGTVKKTKKYMDNIIKEAKEDTKQIVSTTELEGTGFGYKVEPEMATKLNAEFQDWPDIKEPVVKVVTSDTYDTAIDAIDEVYQDDTLDFMPVCVLNFANAVKPGGGWEGGASAQEEQLFYRSTLSGSLHKKFYPMQTLECLYSPRVVIFRENAANNYNFMAKLDGLEKVEESKKLPIVSVISMAAEHHPKLDGTKTKYATAKSRNDMLAKMRQILRTAGHNNHRRLILGALGCGAFGHPPEEVASLWAEILQEAEFKGWFEQLIFAVFDSGDGNNLAVFREHLDGLMI